MCYNHENVKIYRDWASKLATSSPGQQVATHEIPNLAEEDAQFEVTLNAEQESRQVSAYSQVNKSMLSTELRSKPWICPLRLLPSPLSVLLLSPFMAWWFVCSILLSKVSLNQLFKKKKKICWCMFVRRKIGEKKTLPGHKIYIFTWMQWEKAALWLSDGNNNLNFIKLLRFIWIQAEKANRTISCCFVPTLSFSLIQAKNILCLFTVSRMSFGA